MAQTPGEGRRGRRDHYHQARHARGEAVPVKMKTSLDERAAAVARIGKLGQGLSLKGLKIKDLIAEGRK